MFACAASLLTITLFAFASKANAQAPADPSNPYDLTGQCQNSMLDYYIGIEGSGAATADDPTIANIMNAWYGDSVSVTGWGWDYSYYSWNAAACLEWGFEDSIGGSAYTIINEYASWGIITTTQAMYLNQISNVVDWLSYGVVDSATYINDLAGIESDILTNMTDTMRVLPLCVLSAARTSYYYWNTQFTNPPPIHTIGQLTVAAVQGAFFGGVFTSYAPGLGVGLFTYTHFSCPIPTDTEIAISAAIIAAQTVAACARKFLPGTWINNGNTAMFPGSECGSGGTSGGVTCDFSADIITNPADHSYQSIGIPLIPAVQITNQGSGVPDSLTVRFQITLQGGGAPVYIYDSVLRGSYVPGSLASEVIQFPAFTPAGYSLYEDTVTVFNLQPCTDQYLANNVATSEFNDHPSRRIDTIPTTQGCYRQPVTPISTIPTIHSDMPLDCILGYIYLDTLCRSIQTRSQLDSLFNLIGSWDTLKPFMRSLYRMSEYDADLLEEYCYAAADLNYNYFLIPEVLRYVLKQRMEAVLGYRNKLNYLVLASAILHIRVDTVTDSYDSLAYYPKWPLPLKCVRATVLDTIKGIHIRQSNDFLMKAKPGSSHPLDDVNFINFAFSPYWQKLNPRGDVAGIGIDSLGNEHFNCDSCFDFNAVQSGKEYVIFLQDIFLDYDGTNSYYSFWPFATYSTEGGIFAIDGSGNVQIPSDFFGYGTSIPLSTFENNLRNDINTIISH